MSASQAIWLIKLKNGGTYMRDNLAIGFPGCRMAEDLAERRRTAREG